MRCAVAVLAAVVLAGCSKRQPVVTAPPPAPVPTPTQVQTPPSKRRTTQPAAPAAERTGTEQEPPAPTPRTLEALTTPEERNAQLQHIEASLKAAERNVVAVQTRGIAPRVPDDLARVQSLIRHARAAQAAHDLPSARSFAQRAEILSADLLNR